MLYFLFLGLILIDNKLFSWGFECVVSGMLQAQIQSEQISFYFSFCVFLQNMYAQQLLFPDSLTFTTQLLMHRMPKIMRKIKESSRASLPFVTRGGKHLSLWRLTDACRVILCGVNWQIQISPAVASAYIKKKQV